MNAKVKDLMVSPVITTVPHKSAAHVKDIMAKNNIKAVPVVNTENEPVGIVTAGDLLNVEDGTPINKIMTENVVTTPQYSPVRDAARTMRKRKIHHLIVTHEQKVVGILSSFDLLRLVEEKAFVAKNPSSK